MLFTSYVSFEKLQSLRVMKLLFWTKFTDLYPIFIVDKKYPVYA